MAILGTQSVLHSLAVVVGVSIVKLIVLYLQFTHSLIHEAYLLGDRTPPPQLGLGMNQITSPTSESPQVVWERSSREKDLSFLLTRERTKTRQEEG